MKMVGTRRRFLALAGLGSAALAVGLVVRPTTRPTRHRRRVILARPAEPSPCPPSVCAFCQKARFSSAEEAIRILSTRRFAFTLHVEGRAET